MRLLPECPLLRAILMVLCACVGGRCEAAPALPTVAQWTVFETAFTADSHYGNPFQDVEVAVILTAPSGRTLETFAFWDGEDTWRLRVSPDETGTWTFRTRATLQNDAGLNGRTGSFACVPYTGSNPLYRHGAVRVSPHGPYFEQADGTPFFWLADTAWNGALKSAPADWDTYLNDRHAKGFTVVQFVMTQWGPGVGNGDSRAAYEGQDHILIDPTFFAWMDDRYRALSEHGMVPAPVLLWDAPWGEYAKFNSPGRALPEDQLIRLGRYMVARYSAFQPLWILAGDGLYQGAEAGPWQRIGRGVFGEHPLRPATTHPAGKLWAAGTLGNETWFTFLGYQSGHNLNEGTMRWITRGAPATAWRDAPGRPTINLEANYEAHRNFATNKPFSADEVRRTAYWSLLVSPTAGVTYGAHGVWSWEMRTATPLNHEDTGAAHPWQEAMHLPGSAQMKLLRDLFDAVGWWTLEPAPERLVGQPGDQDPAAFVAVSRSKSSGALLLYTPVGQPLIVDTQGLPANAELQWFNPRTGGWTAGGAVSADRARITPPDNQDWVAWLGPKDLSRKLAGKTLQ